MKIIGLTGSIGMGKSMAAALLRRLKVPVHCADEAVHAALAPGGAGVEAVARLYPPALKKDARGRHFIDRKILGAAAFADEKLLKRLEKILHPLTRQAEKKFLRRARGRRSKLAVLDIPLLFEGGRQRDLSAIWVVSATPFTQARRVLSRPGMDAARFHAVLSRQMADAKKRARADGVIPTGLGKAVTVGKLKRALKHVIARSVATKQSKNLFSSRHPEKSSELRSRGLFRISLSG
jgi:dephospho-CoA kinase